MQLVAGVSGAPFAIGAAVQLLSVGGFIVAGVLTGLLAPALFLAVS